MGPSHQGAIDHIELKSTWSKNISTTSSRPYMVNTPDNLQSPNIIPSYEDYIRSELPLPITTDIQPLPMYPTNDTTTETSDETLHKKYLEPLSIRTLNLVHNKDTNIKPVPPSSTPAP